MRPSHVVCALALALAAGSVQAQSFIPGNQIDDFGPLVSERKVAEEELGAAGGEPGMDAKAAERAQERAAIEAYNRERFLRDTWRATP